MSEIQHLFSTNLRKIRQSLEWSQTKLAEKANLSQNYIQQMETAKKFPHPQVIDSLACALGVDVSALFCRETDYSTDMKEFQLAAWQIINNTMSKVIDKQMKDLKENN